VFAEAPRTNDPTTTKLARVLDLLNSSLKSLWRHPILRFAPFLNSRTKELGGPRVNRLAELTPPRCQYYIAIAFRARSWRNVELESMVMLRICVAAAMVSHWILSMAPRAALCDMCWVRSCPNSAIYKEDPGCSKENATVVQTLSSDSEFRSCAPQGSPTTAESLRILYEWIW